MKISLIVMTMLMLVSGSVLALECGSNSARIKGKLIVRGDSSAVLRQLEADNVVRLENKFGAVVGYRYEFFNGRRLLQINTRQGVVSSICRD